MLHFALLGTGRKCWPVPGEQQLLVMLEAGIPAQPPGGLQSSARFGGSPPHLFLSSYSGCPALHRHFLDDFPSALVHSFTQLFIHSSISLLTVGFAALIFGYGRLREKRCCFLNWGRLIQIKNLNLKVAEFVFGIPTTQTLTPQPGPTSTPNLRLCPKTFPCAHLVLHPAPWLTPEQQEGVRLPFWHVG